MAKAKKEKKTSKESGILNVADIRGKTPDELKDLVLGLKREQFNSRFQKMAGEAQKPSRIRAIRKNIAKIKTVLNENKPANKSSAKGAKKHA